MILCSDSEEVLSTLPQALDGVGHGSHSGTLHPLGLSFLQCINKITSDSATTIKFWSCPCNRNAVLGNIGDPKFYRWAWDLCNTECGLIYNAHFDTVIITVSQFNSYCI